LGHPEDEPSAGKPHARICEGESRMAELLDHYLSACCAGDVVRSKDAVVADPFSGGGSIPLQVMRYGEVAH
jgi:adenine-specific DNA methylase